jgi:hypothetical protein
MPDREYWGMNDNEFVFAIESTYVIAPSEDLVGNEGARILSDPSSVIRIEGENGDAIALFTDLDWAERFIVGEQLADCEPARFLSVPAFFEFLLDMLRAGIKTCIFDPDAGAEYARFVPLKRIVRAFQNKMAEPPSDQNSD